MVFYFIAAECLFLVQSQTCVTLHFAGSTDGRRGGGARIARHLWQIKLPGVHQETILTSRDLAVLRIRFILDFRIRISFK